MPKGAGWFLLRALLAGALLLSRASGAEPPHGSFELGLALDRFDYAEYGPTGRLLVRETGVVPAISAALELRGSRWYARAGATASSGDVDYAGRTQSANVAFDDLPVTTTSGATFAGLELQAGFWVDPGQRLALYAGGARRRWERVIEPTTVISRAGAEAPVAGLHEDYAWVELQAGARLSFLRTARTDCHLDARFLQVLAARVDVDWNRRPVTLDLGDRPGARFGLSLRYAVALKWFVRLEAHYALWSFGASSVDVQTRIHEPESKTRSTGLEALLGTSF